LIFFNKRRSPPGIAAAGEMKILLWETISHQDETRNINMLSVDDVVIIGLVLVPLSRSRHPNVEETLSQQNDKTIRNA
jgi:hypothetical protein